MLRRARRLLPLLLLACGGCYTYRPATLDALRPGAAVRAHLTSSGAEGVAQLTGSNSRTLDARFVRSDRDTVVLEVWRSDMMAERAFTPGRLQVPVRRGSIDGVAEKRLSFARTGVLAAVLAVGGYQIVRLAWDRAGGSADGDGSGPGPVIVRIPVR